MSKLQCNNFSGVLIYEKCLFEIYSAYGCDQTLSIGSYDVPVLFSFFLNLQKLYTSIKLVYNYILVL